MAEQASGSTRRKGSGKREESYGPGAGKGKARAPSQGRNKGKAQTKGGGKAKGHVQGQGSGKGSPPAPSAVQLDPLLEAAYQLYLQGRSHNQSRVSRNAWLRNNLNPAPSANGGRAGRTPQRALGSKPAQWHG